MPHQLKEEFPGSSDVTNQLDPSFYYKREINGKIRLPNRPYKVHLTYEMGSKIADIRDKGDHIRLCKKIISFYSDLSYVLGLAKNLNKGTVIELQHYKTNQQALRNNYDKLKEKYTLLRIDINLLIQTDHFLWENILKDFDVIIPDLIFIGNTAGVLKNKKDCKNESLIYSLNR